MPHTDSLHTLWLPSEGVAGRESLQRVSAAIMQTPHTCSRGLMVGCLPPSLAWICSLLTGPESCAVRRECHCVLALHGSR